MKKMLLPAILVLLSFPLVAQNTDLRGLKTVIGKLEGETAAVGKQYAVLIAINKYQNWMALQNPVKDAMQIKDILSRKYYVTDFLELYNEAATKAGIMRLFGKLIDVAKPEDSILIYYAGHGHLDKVSNTGFWIPVDGGTDAYEQANWLPNTQIRGFVSNMKVRHVALIADSCFSGDFLNPTRGMAPTITNEYFKTAYARISRQVLTSGASEAVPDESPFSRQLKLALEGNTSPYLDPFMLYDQIRLGVTQTTPLFGELKDCGHQQGASFLLFLRQEAQQAEKRQEQPLPEPLKPKLTVEKSYGKVRIETKSAGDLYLDGEPQGQVPSGGTATLENVMTGAHKLEMRYDNGSRESDVVVVYAETIASAAFVYTAETTEATKIRSYGEVRIETKSAGELFLDGASKGRVPAGGAVTLEQVESGSHSLEMRYNNGSRESDLVIVERDVMASATFVFGTEITEAKTSPPRQPSEAQAEPNEERQKPGELLTNGDAIPTAAIKIDGRFDDWQGIPVAFSDPYTDKGNLGIRRAFVARDSKMLYVRIEIADDTKSWLLHPNNFNRDHDSIYGVLIGDDKININLNVEYWHWNNTWNTSIGGGLTSQAWKPISKSGSYAMTGSLLEAAFPLDAIAAYVVPGNVYRVNVYAGYPEGGKFVGVDSTAFKQLRF